MFMGCCDLTYGSRREYVPLPTRSAIAARCGAHCHLKQLSCARVSLLSPLPVSHLSFTYILSEDSSVFHALEHVSV